MQSEDTYHAAMLFCKELEAELEGCDLAAWVRSELRYVEPMPIYIPSEIAKSTHYDRFLKFMEYRTQQLTSREAA